MSIKKNLNECNILLAGVGGQGVVLASNIIMQFFVECDLVVKKSEVHGMAQRGGSVVAHVRAGSNIFSPVIEYGTADFLIAIDEEEGLYQKKMLRVDAGRVIELSMQDKQKLIHAKKKNIALLAKFFYALTHSNNFASVVPIGKAKKKIKNALEKVILKSQLELNRRVFEDYFA